MVLGIDCTSRHFITKISIANGPIQLNVVKTSDAYLMNFFQTSFAAQFMFPSDRKGNRDFDLISSC